VKSRRHKRPPKRVQFATSFSGETKARIEKLARETGQSQRQICEHLIELALLFRALGESVPATLFRLGYTPKRTAHGPIWYPRGHPEAPPRGGFEPWQPGELEALSYQAVGVAPLPELSAEERERNEREFRERLAHLEAMKEPDRER
jgi:hypothetical protein